MRKGLILAACVALYPLPSFSQEDQGEPRYVSDEIILSVREAPRNDAGTVGVVRSGERVQLLESLGPQSFARVRSEDGTIGWVTARYLSEEPAAKDELGRVRAELEAARAQLARLDAELGSARGKLEQARPAFELQAENEKLRAVIKEQEQNAAQLARRFNEEKARRKTLVVGAALVGGGIILGLLLPWVASGRRRRGYGDL